MKPNYVCVHGHFYQPPRENPWIDSVQVEPSAAPFHDWNARITSECYAQNAASRVLDGAGRVEHIVNNYSRISFNFGPTLLSWLETQEPRVYAAILEADERSKQRFSGHGNAMAQGYNHAILPLCNARDLDTQVAWGVADFEHRYQRKPEGMWLPETAVDIASLEALAMHGIAFTILEPRQAKRLRKIGARDWFDLDGGIDPTCPYRCVLPSGKSIAIFFYDGPVSRAVAFERLLSRGESFAERILGILSGQREWPELAHIATDGETYGHHHRHGDMALAYALHFIEMGKRATLTNYGEHLERHPPTHEVEIRENTAWSCAHGIERWRSDCGCNSGAPPGWNQAWRAPLRAALDWLRDAMIPAFDAEGKKHFRDPWAARNDYVKLVLDRSDRARAAFFAEHALGKVDAARDTLLCELLESQRHAMTMYTSCGWFFDDLAGIETVQVLRYAARAIELGQRALGVPLEAEFLARIALAKSNASGSGAEVVRTFVKPARIDAKTVAVHYAIHALFDGAAKDASMYGHRIEPTIEHALESGRARLIIGRLRVTDVATRRVSELAGAVLHFGDHRVVGGIRPFEGHGTHEMRARELGDAFASTPIDEMNGLIEGYYPGDTYTLESLFDDDEKAILKRIAEDAAHATASAEREAFDRHRELARYLVNNGHELPLPLRRTAQQALNALLRAAFESEVPDVRRVGRIVEEARTFGVALDDPEIGRVASSTVARLVRRVEHKPSDVALLGGLARLTALAEDLGIRVDTWEAQNVFYRLTRDPWPQWRERAAAGDPESVVFREAFLSLGRALRVRVE